MKTCELCNRSGDDACFELHHLFPGKHRRIKVDRKKDTIVVCKSCGDAIHQQLSNLQLRTEFDTVEKLRIGMASFVAWVRKQPIDTHVVMKKKKRKL